MLARKLVGSKCGRWCVYAYMVWYVVGATTEDGCNSNAMCEESLMSMSSEEAMRRLQEECALADEEGGHQEQQQSGDRSRAVEVRMRVSASII